jgi:hypothetical protein
MEQATRLRLQTLTGGASTAPHTKHLNMPEGSNHVCNIPTPTTAAQSCLQPPPHMLYELASGGG